MINQMSIEKLKQLMHKYGNIIALILGCLFVMIGLTGLEIFLHMRSQAYGVVQTNFGDFIVSDPVLGNKGKPNYSGVNTLIKHGEVVYVTTYTLDESGHRHTPVGNPETRDIDALFFGCSFTFGLGVADEETFPAVVGNKLLNVQPMNYALFGYGPQHLYLQLHDPDFSAHTKNKKGFVIYTILGDHHNRLSGYGSWGDSWANLPRLIPVDEHFEHRGFFGNPLDRIHLARFVLFRTGYYQRREESEEDRWQLCYQILQASRDRLHDILPEFEFIVLVYPESGPPEFVIEHIASLGIEVLDYNDLYDDLQWTDQDLWYDDMPTSNRGHPTALAHKLVGERLSHDLADRITAITMVDFYNY